MYHKPQNFLFTEHSSAQKDFCAHVKMKKARRRHGIFSSLYFSFVIIVFLDHYGTEQQSRYTQPKKILTQF